MAIHYDKVILTRESPSSPHCLQLIEQLSTELGQLYGDDGGANSYDPHEAITSGAAFFVASIEGQPVGCGAIRPLASGVAELKRLFVVPDARGRGISRVILTEIELAASQMGYGCLRLETGQKQTEAIALYESSGYQRIACYGYYKDDPLTICFEKALGTGAGGEPFNAR